VFSPESKTSFFSAYQAQQMLIAFRVKPLL